MLSRRTVQVGVGVVGDARVEFSLANSASHKKYM